VDFGVKRFVYASSCAVYGEAEVLPIKEDCPLRPLSPYGFSKLAAENYVRVFGEVYGLGTVCLRFFNVYGSRQANGEYSGVITKFMDRLVKNLPLMVFGDGLQTRDFVHFCDVVEANLLALKHEGVAGETFNVGSGVATSVNQLASVLLEIAGKAHLGLEHVEPSEGDIRYSVADVSKARLKLGYDPKILLEEGLERLLRQV
jgi:UDP-glucose 4-epimerase